MQVFLTGGTGFVGGHMVQRLLNEGHTVRMLVRGLPGPQGQPSRSNQAAPEYVRGDVVTGEGLAQGLSGCDAVIHLVGIIMETRGASFEQVHHLGTKNVVEAARAAGIQRFVHMSALGVRSDGVAEYQRSKWRGEEEVRHSGIPFCTLRPSLIFGPGDGFVSQMLDIMRRAPLFRPVPGNGKPLFRPIYIDDVTACFVRALSTPASVNKNIDLGGADELALNQVLEEIARCTGIRKPAVHVPMPLMFLVASLAQRMLSKPPVTVDQLRMLLEGSTCDITAMRDIFGVNPVGFAEGLKRYLPQPQEAPRTK